VGPFGVGGITLATTAITLINMGLLSYWLRRRHIGHMGYRDHGVAVLQASRGRWALMAATLWGLSQWSAGWLAYVGRQ
jgi:peptidoglycan biosynthesis protein MviN/MurJ (putative lipid II flippase)